jgi:uncharacterized protein YkwD
MRLRRHLMRNVISALIAPVIVAVALLSFATTTAPKAEALDSEEGSFLAIVNDYRAQNGLGPLVIDERLNGVARWMANDLATNNYFSHTDSLGRDPFTRMDQLGYAVNTWRGENLVAGTMGASESFVMWRDSEGHRANMLGSNYTSIGIARAYSASSSFGWYWATEFGGDAVGAPPPQAPVQPAPAPQPEPAPAEVYVAPEPEPVAPAPVEAEAPPPQAPTASPTPVPAPLHAPDGHAPWFHGVSFVTEKDVSDSYWGDALAHAARTMQRTFSDSAVSAAY